MEYKEENLLSREELAQLVIDALEAKAEYTQCMRDGEAKNDIRQKAHAFYLKRDELQEAARSILLQKHLKRK